jgi:hypothetical protein
LPEIGYRITEEKIKKIVALIKKGCTIQASAEEVGYGGRNFRKWLAMGGFPAYANDKHYVDPDDAVEPFKSLAERVWIADAQARNVVSTVVYAGAKKDYVHGLKWLQNRHPREWRSIEYDPERRLAQDGRSDETKPTVHIHIPQNGRELPDMSNEHANIVYVEDGEEETADESAIQQ